MGRRTASLAPPWKPVRPRPRSPSREPSTSSRSGSTAATASASSRSGTRSCAGSSGPRANGSAASRMRGQGGTDCPRSHGASWDGRKPGGYGDAGVYSFYATKTISTGEGGVLVSSNDDLLEFSRAFRNYGKPDHRVEGLNFRMNEFTAALATVQT